MAAERPRKLLPAKGPLRGSTFLVPGHPDVEGKSRRWVSSEGDSTRASSAVATRRGGTFLTRHRRGSRHGQEHNVSDYDDTLKERASGLRGRGRVDRESKDALRAGGMRSVSTAGSLAPYRHLKKYVIGREHSAPGRML